MSLITLIYPSHICMFLFVLIIFLFNAHVFPYFVCMCVCSEYFPIYHTEIKCVTKFGLFELWYANVCSAKYYFGISIKKICRIWNENRKEKGGRIERNAEERVFNIKCVKVWSKIYSVYIHLLYAYNVHIKFHVCYIFSVATWALTFAKPFVYSTFSLKGFFCPFKKKSIGV